MHNVELAARQRLKVDTGWLVALDNSVNYGIEYVGGIEGALFSGEVFFFAQLTGAGNVWLQSMPFSRLVGKIGSALPASSGGVGEGPLIDSLGGIGHILTGR
jgi:uncharacterized protein (AIM24 family)